ncbi:hypothetical protein [Thermogemmatispora sp.]|uniref:hypothetical protein n=1 Tax=Thermogemmatispora sp. TaxID=1968838 RepID=UPI0035E41698
MDEAAEKAEIAPQPDSQADAPATVAASSESQAEAAPAPAPAPAEPEPPSSTPQASEAATSSPSATEAGPEHNTEGRQPSEALAPTARATDPYSGPAGASFAEASGPYPEPLLVLPPPPPTRQPRTVRLGTALIIGGLVFLLSTTSALLIALYASAGGFVPLIKHLNAPSTATASALSRRLGQRASPTPSVTALPTATVLSGAQPTATAAAQPTVVVIGPTPTVSVPYSGPTADTLLHAFIANYLPIACSADGGCIRALPPNWWLSCCEFYPAHGSYQFYDTSGGAPGFGTEMIVAVFQMGAHAKTVLDQLISSQAWTAPQYAIVNNCALLTENIYAITDWNQYIAIMQQLC